MSNSEISSSSVLGEEGDLIAFSKRAPRRGAEDLTSRRILGPWTSFPLGRGFSSLGVCLRFKLRIAARVALPVMILSGMAKLSYAQEDATWFDNPISSDWNNAGNWRPLPPTGPLIVPTGLAAFSSPSSIQTITFSAPATVQTLQFDAPAYAFSLSRLLTITGNGIGVPVATNVPIFDVPPATPLR